MKRNPMRGEKCPGMETLIAKKYFSYTIAKEKIFCPISLSKHKESIIRIETPQEEGKTKYIL